MAADERDPMRMLPDSGHLALALDNPVSAILFHLIALSTVHNGVGHEDQRDAPGQKAGRQPWRLVHVGEAADVVDAQCGLI